MIEIYARIALNYHISIDLLLSKIGFSLEILHCKYNGQGRPFYVRFERFPVNSWSTHFVLNEINTFLHLLNMFFHSNLRITYRVAVFG